jgi:glycosyltransferase involved in cell wall biosynthesis
MNSIVYHKQSNVMVKTLPDGWANVGLPDDSIGVALDPVLHAIWAEAEGCSLAQVAQNAQVPIHLAAAALSALQRAGLLLGEAHAEPQLQTPPASTSTATSLSLVILHRRPQAELEPCIESFLNQKHPKLVQATIIAAAPIPGPSDKLRVIECDSALLANTLVRQLLASNAEASLVLDSQARLAPGSLAEMLSALELDGRVAAVAPRVMWRQRPGFVANMGDWRYASDADRDPYAGQLEVGQFQRRWQETPAMSFGAGLIRSAALQQVGAPDGKLGVDRMAASWCHQAREYGHHILAATQAVVYGPWSEQGTQSRKLRAQGIRGRNQHRGLVSPATVSTVHEGAPALTLQNVRALYGHLQGTTRLFARPRVALVAKEAPRHQAMAKALSATVDVTWFVPRSDDDATVRQVCEMADLVIITAELLEKLAFLQGWHRPIVVDTQPALRSIQSPHLWPQTIDGLICATEEELEHWHGRLAAHNRPLSRDQLVLVPTGIEPSTPVPGFALRKVHPEIEAGDKVILWCGGWEPFDDPLAAIHALDRVRATYNDVKLLYSTFEGNSQGRGQDAMRQAMRLTAELGLAHAVLLVQELPAAFQGSYLAEADLGLLLRKDALEGTLREPTALAASIAAGLPLITTRGSAGSGLVRRFGLGHSVPAGDIPALAQTISECLRTPRSATRDRFKEAEKALDWAQTITPLAELCTRPRFALEQECSLFLDMKDMLCPPPAPTAVADLPAKAWQVLRGRGFSATVHEASQYIRWKVGL